MWGLPQFHQFLSKCSLLRIFETLNFLWGTIKLDIHRGLTSQCLKLLGLMSHKLVLLINFKQRVCHKLNWICYVVIQIEVVLVAFPCILFMFLVMVEYGSHKKIAISFYSFVAEQEGKVILDQHVLWWGSLLFKDLYSSGTCRHICSLTLIKCLRV